VPEEVPELPLTTPSQGKLRCITPIFHIRRVCIYICVCVCCAFTL
jgi:hypothetical protein